MTKPYDFDALVVGGGFGGIYQLYKLRERGLSVKVIDAAGDVGGTWYWNRYPGAMSDTESYIYRAYPWKEHYIKQPEALAYLNHVVDRHDLRKHMQFNTELTSAQWDDANKVWAIGTKAGETFKTRYLVTALGLLSKTNYPAIPGIETFKGEMYHTGKWPNQHDFKNKRVGVIGNGSTGVQLITAIAKEVKQLVCFQPVDGSYTRVAIKGRDGTSLKDHWAAAGGPTSYLGVCVPNFPNLFMITGPNGPFTNIPPTLETHVEFIAGAIANAEADRNDAAGATNPGTDKDEIVVEATQQAEEAWTDLCRELSDNSLFKKTDSWIFGANVPGKKNAVMFYFGGLGKYREKLAEVIKGGYQGFKPF